MNDSERTPKFTWGDTVRVSSSAPSEFRPGEYAALCAITEPDSAEPEYFYTIEFGDRSSVHIAESYLTLEEPSADASSDGNAKA